MTDYAKLGTLTLIAHESRHVRKLPSSGGLRPVPPPVTGWVPPTVIYDKMRAIDPAAREMNALMLANVRKPLLRAAWDAWFKNWQAFFEKYQSAWAFSRWAVPFYTDDLARQTEGYRSEYESFRATYAAERDADGNPLPPPSTPIPTILPDPTDQKDEKKDDGLGIKIPWWFWMLGGVALVGAGYATYRYVQKARAIRRVLDEKVVPRVLQAYGGPAGGELSSTYAQLQDVSGDPGRKVPAPLAPSEIFTDAAPAVPPRPHRHVVHATHATYASSRDPADSWEGEPGED